MPPVINKVTNTSHVFIITQIPTQNLETDPLRTKALPFLFLTEMWERFGFYVIQGLLVLYLTQFMGHSDDYSFTLVGIFTALVYISPIFGGYAADKFLGNKIAILWGGFLLICGYFLLSLPIKHFFHPALATIIVGNGLFKPNISSTLGKQYEQNDAGRDAAFTIFYIGINVGVLLAGFSSGYIKEEFGWHICFFLASVGLMIGTGTFLFGTKYMRNINPPRPVTPNIHLALFAICAAIIFAITFLFRIQSLANTVLPIGGLILLVLLCGVALRQPPEARNKMFLLITLIISSIVFWALFLQVFFSANLYIDRLVDKNFFGFHLTTTVFYASESIYIILLGPIFALLWNKLDLINKNPGPLTKFTLGIFLAGLSFVILGLSTYFPASDNLINPMWIFAAYLVLTVGELLLSPIGLSAVTQLAPENLVGIMMGAWFVATGFGGIFAGILGKFSSLSTPDQTTAQKLDVYHHAFLEYAAIACICTLILILFQYAYKKLTNQKPSDLFPLS